MKQFKPLTGFSNPSTRPIDSAPSAPPPSGSSKRKQDSQERLSGTPPVAKKKKGSGARPSLANFPALTLPRHPVLDLNSIKGDSLILESPLTLLEKKGWNLREYERLADQADPHQLAQRKVIDPGIQLNNQNSSRYHPDHYLFTLAYKVGHANNPSPIPIENRDQYTQSRLQRDAHSIQNNFTLRNEMLAEYGKDSWQNQAITFNSSALEELYQHAYLNSTTLSIDQFEQILRELESPNKNASNAEIYSEENTKQTSLELKKIEPILFKIAQSYFDKTNQTLKPEQLKFYTSDLNGDLKWLTTERALEIENSCANNLQAIGIFNSDEIYSLIKTGLTSASGEPAPDIGEGWHCYNFYYAGTILDLLIQSDKKSGEILNLFVPTTQPYKVTQSYIRQLSSEFSNCEGVEAILAGKHHHTFREWAATVNLEPSQFLKELMRPENCCRASLELPGFYVYRKTLKNRENETYTYTLTGIIKDKDGEIIDATPGTELDELFSHFSELEKSYSKLIEDGWTIQLNPQHSSYCNREKKQIWIGSNNLESPIMTLIVLSHEISHAKYQPKEIHSEEEKIHEWMLDEGHALFQEHMLLDQAKNNIIKERIIHSMYKTTGKEIIDAQIKVYEKWQNSPKGNQDKVAAIEAFGKLYATYHPSTFPIGVDYLSVWKTQASINAPNGDQNRNNLLTELLSYGAIPLNIPSEDLRSPKLASAKNIIVILRLPKQRAENTRKIVFMSVYDFPEELKNKDPKRIRKLASLIEMSLLYGKLTIHNNDNKLNTKTVNSKFNLNNIDCHIQYILHDSGQLSHFKIISPQNLSLISRTDLD
ncbi:MAG: hypothetical protein ON057_000039 [Glomeribacter sp. 1016415]|nr:hypothetical protein [Glomeribacter sp. 1016415]